MVLESILLSVVVVSLISLIGIVLISKQNINNIIIALVSFAAGAMLGGAFFDLLPEAVASAGTSAFLYVLVGMVVFFVIERFLQWHHHHHNKESGGKCPVHPLTYLSLIGDGIHNFIDGAIIAVSFLASPALGVTSTIAIIAHEIPQEIGDFGILVFGGFSKRKAVFWNFATALAAIAGALITYFASFFVGGLTAFLVPFAAGGFIYIATSDLIPEMHKEKKLNNTILQFALFLVGLGLMAGLSLVLGG